MAHAYTPGLRLAERCVVRRERRLPLKGRTLVQADDRVQADTVVAGTELPGNLQTLNVAAQLGIDPAAVPAALAVPVGGAVAAGDVVARGKSLFGLMKQSVTAPVGGTLESVSAITGQAILREPPIPVEVAAYVAGRVAEVLPEEGVIVETTATFLQGIFGVGGETRGPIAIVAGAPEEPLDPSRLDARHRGHVVVGGAHVTHDGLMAAREHGVAAVVVGGFDDRDLRRLLGRDLGVAITGAEELGITLILTEGFGRIPMSDRAWRLLSACAGREASVSGATQIRAGVLRPEILVPLEGATEVPGASGESGAVEIGSVIRVIREPHFGRLGRVVAMPPELQALATEARVRVMEVEFDGGERAVVPRANVERIER